MSGMRLGEALAMSGDNLDSRNCQYNVTETHQSGPVRAAEEWQEAD